MPQLPAEPPMSTKSSPHDFDVNNDPIIPPLMVIKNRGADSQEYKDAVAAQREILKGRRRREEIVRKAYKSKKRDYKGRDLTYLSDDTTNWYDWLSEDKQIACLIWLTEGMKNAAPGTKFAAYASADAVGKVEATIIGVRATGGQNQGQIHKLAEQFEAEEYAAGVPNSNTGRELPLEYEVEVVIDPQQSNKTRRLWFTEHALRRQCGWGFGIQ